MVLNIQPVVPFRLSDDWNLHHPHIVPVASQFDLTGRRAPRTSGLGDSVVTAFLSPSKGSHHLGCRRRLFLIPTATDDALGSGEARDRRRPRSPSGSRVDGPWAAWPITWCRSRAARTGGKVNATFLNPFIVYNWRSGAGVTLNVEYTHDWENDVDVLVVNFPTLTGVTRFGSQTVSFAISPRFHFAPETRPDYGLRAAVILVFPK